ncbi:MAG TPA: hypothetical protein PLY34_17115 [Ferruginibacter sp.]|nr:hypothetical protein [Ferruginibacter sp.]HPH90623.1 hypothetical protein [Ferruginibacter sp.]
MQKPEFNKRIFWDVNFDMIDYQKKSAFVIERVFERGDVEDIRQARRYYGDEVVVNSLTAAKWLRYDIYVFVKNLFDLKPEDFRCYTQRQLSQLPWSY